MTTSEQKTRAKTFLSLHETKQLLILPNVWNPIGARMLAAKGYPAIATASAAISSSLGYMDGERIALDTLLDCLRRIASSVDVPVTADIERGYAESIDDLAVTVARVIDAGIVGINIEDSLVEGGHLRPIAEQCERIAAVREAAMKHNLHLFINARVDSFVSGEFDSLTDRIDDAIQRAQRYHVAGADCVYPMGPGDRQTVTALRQAIVLPINILATSAALSLPELEQLGVNRVSFGPFILRACLGKMSAIYEELKSYGSYDCFTQGAVSREESHAFLRSEKEPPY